MRKPGDRAESTDAMIRVDQAGEYGATRIYQGQLAILGDRHPASRAIGHMAEQEERHRAFFDRMIAERGVRPTLLQPFWNVAGFALGAVTAATAGRNATAMRERRSWKQMGSRTRGRIGSVPVSG